MKKLFVIFIALLFTSLIFAQDVLELFMYTDNYTLTTPLYLSDGTTPIPDGYLIEVCLTATPDTYDYDNDPHGTELNNQWAIDYMNGTLLFGMAGFFGTSSYFIWESTVASPAEPVANCGDQAYLRIYDAVDIASATEYITSAFLIGPAAGTGPWDTEVGGWGAWTEIGGGEPIPPAGGTVTFPSGGSITFLPGNSGTIDMTFDPANPPPGLPSVEVPNPQNLWWDYDTSGATITVWPVRLRLEFPLAAGIIYESSAILHYTDAAWWGLVHPTLPVHPNNVGQNYNFSYDYTVDPSYVEFDTWTLSDWGMDSDNPLPVSLTSFTAIVVQNEFISINWTTQSECNMVGYKVYRSESDFTSVDFISEIISAENTTEPHDYIFNDAEVVDGVTYNYWLESMDYDGSTNLWGPISATMEGEIIPELPNTTQLYGNYPNPFNPITSIKFDVKEGETAELTIFNVKGQVVESMRLNAGYHNIPWDAKSVTSGVYFYKLRTESYTQIKKMMLLK